jgi:hypothetical protein
MRLHLFIYSPYVQQFKAAYSALMNAKKELVVVTKRNM